MTGIESLMRIQDRASVDNIKEMTECFVSQLDPLKVILFGSFADGSYTDESDYDFYIVVNDDPDIAAAGLNAILLAEKCRFSARKHMLAEA